MVRWRFNRDVVGIHDATVEDVWPDVDKTAVFRDLMEWGIDARKIPIFTTDDGTLGVTFKGKIRSPEGELHVDPTRLADYEAAGGRQGTYIGLVHELTHFLQAVEDRMSGRFHSMEEWISVTGEKEAVRRSASQARLMGWSSEKLSSFMCRIYDYCELQETVDQIIAESQEGYMSRRRPEVWVRGHRRQV